MQTIKLRLQNDFVELDKALYSDSKYVTIHAGRRCFSGDTLVHTVRGYKRIDQIIKGDEIYSFDCKTKRIVVNRVRCVHVFDCKKTKPMLELTWFNSSIRCTYDHKILARQENEREARWISAFIYAWGRMDTDTRHRLQVLCKQYGEDINDQLQVFGYSKGNDSGVRWEWLSANYDTKNRWQVPHYQDTQGSRKSVYCKSAKEETDKSHRLRQDKQQSRKLRVGDTQRECRSFYASWTAIKELGRKVWNSFVEYRRCFRDKGEGEKLSKREKCCDEYVQRIQSKVGNNNRFALWTDLEVSIIDTVETYDLEIENNHSYLVTKNDLIVHNSGKTYNSVQWLLDELFSNKLTALWVDTVQRNIDKYMSRYFQHIAGDVWQYLKWETQAKILRFPTGSYMDMGSAERPELLEGFEYDRVVVNEAGIVFKKEGLWGNVIEPMTRGDNNKTRIIGTPKGRNDFFRMAGYGRQGKEDWEDYHFSAYDSPFWNPDELDKIKERVPQIVWKQEYLAEFIEGEGIVFRGIRKCFSKELLNEGIDGRRYIMAVDLAKHQDFTVILIADADTRQTVFMDRFNQIDWVFQKRRIVEAYNRFLRPRMILDSTGIGDVVFDDLRAMGLRVEGVKFTAQTKRELVQGLSVMIDSQKILFYPWPELVNELEMFGYDVTPSGNITYNAPEGFHDDTVVALALLAYGLEKYTNTSETLRQPKTMSTKELMAQTYEAKDDQMPNIYAELIKRQLRSGR